MYKFTNMTTWLESEKLRRRLPTTHTFLSFPQGNDPHLVFQRGQRPRRHKRAPGSSSSKVQNDQYRQTRTDGRTDALALVTNINFHTAQTEASCILLGSVREHCSVGLSNAQALIVNIPRDYVAITRLLLVTRSTKGQVNKTIWQPSKFRTTDYRNEPLQ